MRPALSLLRIGVDQWNTYFILIRMSSKSEEDMKPVPSGSLLLKATLAYLIFSSKHLNIIISYVRKVTGPLIWIVFCLLFMEIMEKLAELRVGDISLSLLPKVKLHKVTVIGKGDLLVEGCFREDPHKFIKANLNIQVK